MTDYLSDYSPYKRMLNDIIRIQNQQRVLHDAFDALNKDYKAIAPCDREAELTRIKSTAIETLCTAAAILTEADREITKILITKEASA